MEHTNRQTERLKIIIRLANIPGDAQVLVMLEEWQGSLYSKDTHPIAGGWCIAKIHILWLEGGI